MDIFQERGHQADVKNKLSVEQLHGIVGNYDGMVIRSATKVLYATRVYVVLCHSLFVFGKRRIYTTSMFYLGYVD